MSKSDVFSRLRTAIVSTKNVANSIKPKSQKLQPTNNSIITTNSNQPKTRNDMIRELLSEKDPQMLLKKFMEMSKYSFFRTQCRNIYKLIFNRFALTGNHDLIEQALVSQKIYITREGFASRIIYLYGKYGMFDHAFKVFDELPERNIKQGTKCLGSLLGAAANSGKYEEVYELFRELPKKLSIELDLVCYNTTTNALCRMGKVDDALSLLNELEANGLKPDVFSFNTFLRFYYEEGEFEEGEKMWERMIQSQVAPNISSYNFKVQGLVRNGKLEEAIELVLQLKNKSLNPIVDTFNALICGCVKEDDLDGTLKWYNELVKSHLPNKKTLNTLVPFLCEKSEYGFAFEICRKMLDRGSHWLINEAVLQDVVDGLAKNSMIEEAKTIVKLGQTVSSSGYGTYHLVMPETYT